MKRFKIVHEDNVYTLYTKRVWLQRTLQISFLVTVLSSLVFFIESLALLQILELCFSVGILIFFPVATMTLVGELWVREKSFYNEEELHQYIAELKLKDNSKKVYYLE